MAKVSCAMWLRPGQNEAAITIETDSEHGVCLSAVSVIPNME